MIRLHRTVDVQEGKLFEAIALAKEMAAYFNESYNTKVETLINIGGKVNQIIMSNEYESLAAMEELRTRAQADEAVMAMMKKWNDSGFFVNSSMVDQYFKSVD